MLAVFAATYGILYLILQLEDYALLAGAILGFAALTVVMFVTLARRLERQHGTARAALKPSACRAARDQGAAPVLEQAMQLLAVEGLGEVVVHAGLQAAAAVLVEGVGGDGDDRRAAARPRRPARRRAP